MLYYLWPTTAWAAVMAPVSAAAVLVIRQFPVAGALTLAAVQVTGLPLQMAPENPAGLAPLLIAVYTLGRRVALAPGISISIIYLLCFAVLDFTVATIVFGAIIFGGVFTFGRLVQLRSVSTHRVRTAAATLEKINVASHTARIVADERARLGGHALAVIRRSVDAMRREASAAVVALDPDLIARIPWHGRTAVTELRWLLGLLRSDAGPPAAPAVLRRTTWLTDAGVGTVLVALTALDSQLPHQPVLTSAGQVLLLLLPATVLIRRSHPLQACLAAAAVVGAIMFTGTPLFTGFGAGTVITLGLLGWSAAAHGRPATWAALGILAVVAVLPVALADPGNIPIMLAVFGLPAFAGHAWSAHEREGRTAEARAAKMRSDLDLRVEQAVQAERLRIARDLHDVTSHAVGVMVLQATAAQALQASDAPAARRALHTVETVGAKALAELAVLFRMLDAGAIGAPGLAQAQPEAIDALIARMRTAGMRVEFTAVGAGRAESAGEHAAPATGDDAEGADWAESADGPCGGDGAAAILYRVVQEALTNVARHAPAASVRVHLTVTADASEVRIDDDGAGHHPSVVGSGFGLAGLAERVRAAGGHFTARPRVMGGFEVLARIPATAWPAPEPEPEPEPEPDKQNPDEQRRGCRTEAG